MRHSTVYTLIFATIVCVICAVLVSGSAVSLSERQDANRLVDKYKNVLYAAGLASPTEQISADEVRQRFSKVRAAAVELSSGEETDAVDLESYDAERAAADPENGFDAPPNNLAMKRMAKYQVVYQVIGDDGEPSMYVLPIKGYGLWSTLYGFIALDKDTTTIRGITYYDHKETAGLGGEVDNPGWKGLWPGRKALDENWEPAIDVIKGQAGSPEADPHRVDGLSGATLTSRGVANMLSFWLGEHGFGPYLANIRAANSQS